MFDPVFRLSSQIVTGGEIVKPINSRMASRKIQDSIAVCLPSFIAMKSPCLKMFNHSLLGSSQQPATKS